MADEQPRSGALKVSGTRQTGRIVKRLVSKLDYRIPELGEPNPDASETYFYDADWQPSSGKMGDLILNYSWKKPGRFDTELRASTIDAPLSHNKDYLVKWDHYLTSSDSTATAPESWDTLKKISEIEGNSEYDNFFIRTNVNASGSETIIKSRTKSSNTYQKPTVEVLETIYWTEEEKAINISKSVGLLVDPSNSYGRSTEDGNMWLVTSCPITRDGGYWVCRRTYKFNDSTFINSGGEPQKGWDLEMYGFTE